MTDPSKSNPGQWRIALDQGRRWWRLLIHIITHGMLAGPCDMALGGRGGDFGRGALWPPPCRDDAAACRFDRGPIQNLAR